MNLHRTSTLLSTKNDQLMTNDQLEHHHHLEDVMGTMVSIDIRAAADPQAATRAVVEWLHHVDATFSPYKEDSVVSAIGRGELGLCDAGPEMHEVLRLCEQIRVDSGGAFDVFEVPAPNGTRFDPSGLVKGWSIEAAAAILETHGVHNFCINAGGDVALRGGALPGNTWRVGVTDPADQNNLLCVVDAPGPLAVATSGTYARGAHIIDPRNNLVTTTIASASVIGADLSIADGYATAAFVLGDDAIAWATSIADYEVLVVHHDGRQDWTPGFTRYLDRRADDAVGPVDTRANDPQ